MNVRHLDDDIHSFEFLTDIRIVLCQYLPIHIRNKHRLFESRSMMSPFWLTTASDTDIALLNGESEAILPVTSMGDV